MTKRLTLLKDNIIDYPELWLKVYIQSCAVETRQFAEMFTRARCKRANTPEEADLVVFGGGADVDPVLYGEVPHPSTHISPERDQMDLVLYKKCLDAGIAMFGVCRGAQFLHVMNGGKLYQDINHHYGEHTMWDLIKKEQVSDVSSVHHQACRPNPLNGMNIIAEAHISDRRWLNNEKVEKGHKKDIEAFFYRDTCCLGVQGHPEYTGYPGFTKWCLNLIEEQIITNPDISWSGTNLRIHPDILGLRMQEWKARTAAASAVAN